MSNVKDDRGYNQGYSLEGSSEVRLRRRAEWIAQCMRSDVSESVLEIGCGRGEVSFWLAEQTGKKVLGTDLCVPFIEGAQKNFVLPNLQYEVLDFNNPEKVSGRTFDYITGNGILHHLYYKLPEALQTLRSLLNKNGKLIFMEPNIYNPYCAVIFNVARDWAHLEPDEMAFSKTFITKLLQEAGFRNIKVDYKDFLLPGIPESFVKPSIVLGDLLEKIPVVKMVSQSLFIEAEK